MRLFASVSLVFVLSASLAAQTGSQPNLVLTIVGGTAFGGHLWTIDKQTLSRLGPAPQPVDTLRLSRDVSSGIVLGATASYFASSHVGLHAEVSYLGLGFDSNCVPVYLNPDSSGGFTDLRRNGQVCDDISSQTPSGSMITIFGGVTLRAASRGTVSPFLRAGIGFANLSASSIDVAGAFIDNDNALKVRQVIGDPNPRRTAVTATLGAGITSPIGTGYQFRFEVRDHILSLDELTGPGNPGGSSATRSRFRHNIALTLGLDIVMEKKRGRRY